MREQYINPETKSQVDLTPLQRSSLTIDGYIISMVSTPRAHRGLGGASFLMELVLADADREGIILELEILPSGPMNYGALKAWYNRLGFNQIDDNWYVRYPKV